MRRALDLAARALEEPGTMPFGRRRAGRRDPGRGAHHAPSTFDPTSHGEVEAIRAACARLRCLDLTGSDLYSSCEPCPICISTMVVTGVSRLFYGATLDQSRAALAPSICAAAASSTSAESAPGRGSGPADRSFPSVAMLNDEAVSLLENLVRPAAAEGGLNPPRPAPEERGASQRMAETFIAVSSGWRRHVSEPQISPPMTQPPTTSSLGALALHVARIGLAVIGIVDRSRPAALAIRHHVAREVHAHEPALAQGRDRVLPVRGPPSSSRRSSRRARGRRTRCGSWKSPSSVIQVPSGASGAALAGHAASPDTRLRPPSIDVTSNAPLDGDRRLAAEGAEIKARTRPT